MRRVLRTGLVQFPREPASYALRSSSGRPALRVSRPAPAQAAEEIPATQTPGSDVAELTRQFYEAIE